MATTLSFSHEVNFPPLEVRPGHIMFAPLRTNFIAPLSTCCGGNKNGYLCKSRNTGMNWPSLSLKKIGSPLEPVNISI